MLKISTCTRKAVVTYTPWLHNVVIQVLKGRGLLFDQWIHPQMVHRVEASEYNNL